MRRLPFLLIGLLIAGSAHAGWPTDTASLADRLKAPEAAQRKAATERLAQAPRRVALTLLPAMLDDADVEVRLAAAEAVVVHRIPSEAQVLPWLADADPRVRAAACKVIGLGASERATAPLTRALSDSQVVVRRAAARALGSSRSADATAALLGHLDDAVPDVRVEVLSALARLRDPRAVTPVAGRAQDGAPEVRMAALRAVGELGDEKAGRAVLGALSDTASEVRREAAVTMGRLRVAEAVRPLAALTKRTEPIEVRRAALVALARLGSEDAVSAVVEALRDDERSTAPAREALSRVAPEHAKVLIGALSRATDERAAFAIASALTELEIAEAEPVILRAVRDGRISSVSAARVLGGLRDSGALTLLVEKLGDPSPAVRREAVAALTRSLDRTPSGHPVDAVLAMLAGDALRPSERRAYLGLLGATRSERALPTLLSLSRSTRIDERRAAVAALGQVPSADTDQALLGALNDDEPLVREAAATALAMGGGDRACAELVRRLEQGGGGARALVEPIVASCLGRASPATSKAASALLAKEVDTTRDALAEGLGRNAHAEATPALVELSRSLDAADRRKAAEALVARGAVDDMRRLADDRDGSVRAAALWGLGAARDAGAKALLVTHLADDDAAAAANAAIALGRVGPDAEGQSALCKALDDARAMVRASALTALPARCTEAGERERALLGGDPSSAVRLAAAGLIVRTKRGAEDAAALGRCAAEDAVLAVSRACLAASPSPKDAEPVSVLVVAEGGRARATAPFSLVLADGSVRYGLTDRRGSVFEAKAPKGVIRLAPRP